MRHFFIIALAILCACQSYTTDFGAAADFFPPTALLEEGVVNKYYEHFTYTDGQAPLIRIRYKQYLLDKDGRLLETIYGGGFDPVLTRTFEFDSSRQNIVNEFFYYNGDTLQSEISASGFHHWSQQADILKYKRIYPNTAYSLEIIQLETEEVIQGNRKMKHFEQQVLVDINEGAYQASSVKEVIYAEGLGLFSEYSQYDTYTIDVELIEQMPLEEFEKRSAHGLKRVGYLDPEKFLDQQSKFSPCGSLDTVRDYYNSTPDGRYSRNKNGLRDDIFAKLDTDKLALQSGYLTFRFMVNCQGEAGWFVADGVDFNYQPKTFDQETIDHLFGILSSLEQWRPVSLDPKDHSKSGVNQDAYFYITFKLEDGEITHILP